MGLFDFLKGKKKDADEPGSAKVNRSSRKIVTPGQKPGAGTSSVTKSPSGPTKPPTQRIAQPGAKPNAPAATPSGPKPAAGAPAKPAQSGPKPAASNGTQMVRPSGPKPAAPKPDDGLIIGSSGGKPASPQTASQRAKPQGPIVASKPLEFAGDLASGARGGPARTGDGALLEFLTGKARLLDDGQAEQVRSKAEGDGLAIDSAAVQLGFLTEDKLVTALTQECWVPHLKVDKYEIRKKALDTITREDAEHYGVFPVDKLGSLLTLAMVNPLDTETIRVLESKTGLDIKKVVATRAEITQGIEKYYSGAVQAKEGSLGFVQDVEAKSVTQMISNVAKKSEPLPAVKKSEPLPAAKKSEPLPAVKVPAHDVDIVPEIEDIDELLSSDEVIAPAIIEPVQIKADEPATLSMDDIEPIAASTTAPPAKQVESERIGIDELDEIAISGPSLAPPPAPAKAKPKDDGLIDLDVDLSLPEPTASPSHGPMKTPLPAAHEAAPSTGALERRPAIAPVAKAPIAPPAKPPVAPVAPAAKAPVAPVAKKPAAPEPVKPATGRRESTKRIRQTDVVNLIPVMEEEFQHAITHGRSQLFDKWVGLQSRNRIINAVAVEDDVAAVLSSLLKNGRTI